MKELLEKLLDIEEGLSREDKAELKDIKQKLDSYDDVIKTRGLSDEDKVEINKLASRQRDLYLKVAPEEEVAALKKEFVGKEDSGEFKAAARALIKKYNWGKKK